MNNWKCRPSLLGLLIVSALLVGCGDSGPPPADEFGPIEDTVQDAEVEAEVEPEVEPEVAAEPEPELPGPEPEPELPPAAEPEPELPPEVIEDIQEVPDFGPEVEIPEGDGYIPPCESAFDCLDYLDLPTCQTAQCVAGECLPLAIPNCCEVSEDCEGFGTACCDIVSCGADNQCLYDPIQGCCETSGDCSDGDAATADFCKDACVLNGCIHLPPLCAVDEVYAEAGFEGDLGLFQKLDTDPLDNVTVLPLKALHVGGSWSAYFGDPACQTYYDGPLTDCEPSSLLANESSSVGVELESDTIVLPFENPSYLRFWLRMAAEPAINIGTDEVPDLVPTDYLRISIDDGFGKTILWNSTVSLGQANTTNGEFVFVAVDLSDYAGLTVAVTFSFTADSTGNYNKDPDSEPWYGAYIDDVEVRTACGFCLDDDSCPDDFNGCTVDTCTAYANSDAGVCAYEPSLPGQECQSCVQPGDCGDTSCYNHECVDQLCESDQKLSCCVTIATFPGLGQPDQVITEGFETGFDDWLHDDPLPNDNLGWWVDGGLPFQGDASLFFGDPSTQNYVAVPSNPAQGTIWTPAFQFDDAGGALLALSFWLNMSTEYDGVSGQLDPEASFDNLIIKVMTVGEGEVEVAWHSATAIGNTTNGQWQQVGVDLSPWAGAFARVGFEFDSADTPGTGFGNTSTGVRIDELTVTTFCGAEQCLGFQDCDDGNACTVDSCHDGSCVSEQTDPSCCDEDTDCVHENTCVKGTCEGGGCVYEYKTLQTCCYEGEWLDGFGLWTDFESGEGDWTVAGDADPVVWHLTSDEAHSGANSFNFSNPGNGWYSLPGFEKTKGKLISPAFLVPAFDGGLPYASFWFKLETEWDGLEADEFFDQIVVDELRVGVATFGDVDNPDPGWVSHYIQNTTRGEWLESQVDLDQYRGLNIQLVFDFDTGDGNFNDFAGPFIDDVQTASTCKPSGAIQCVYGGDCVPSDECHSVKCIDFKCIETVLTTPECCEEEFDVTKLMDFEGEDLEWTVGPCTTATSGAPAADVVWQLANEDNKVCMEPQFGDGFMYFGNGTDIGGAAGQVSCSEALSQPIMLEEELPWLMSYWINMDVELAAKCGLGGANFVDVFTLQVVDLTDGGASLLMQKDDLQCNQYDDWVKFTFDLSPWAGSTIQLLATFNSWDAQENSGCGIGIDHIEFERGCPEPF